MIDWTQLAAQVSITLGIVGAAGTAIKYLSRSQSREVAREEIGMSEALGEVQLEAALGRFHIRLLEDLRKDFATRPELEAHDKRITRVENSVDHLSEAVAKTRWKNGGV